MNPCQSRDLESPYRLSEIGPCSSFLLSVGVQPRSKFGFFFEEEMVSYHFHALSWADISGALSESDPFYSVYVTYLSTNDEEVN